MGSEKKNIDNHKTRFANTRFRCYSLPSSPGLSPPSKDAPCLTSRRSLASLAVRIPFALAIGKSSSSESLSKRRQRFRWGGGRDRFLARVFLLLFTASSLFFVPILFLPGRNRDSDRGARALKSFIGRAQEEKRTLTSNSLAFEKKARLELFTMSGSLAVSAESVEKTKSDKTL